MARAGPARRGGARTGAHAARRDVAATGRGYLSGKFSFSAAAVDAPVGVSILVGQSFGKGFGSALSSLSLAGLSQAASSPLDHVAKTSGPDGPFGSDYARYAGLGFQLAASIALFALGGWWLDERLGSSPWLLLLGVFAGFGGGLYSLLKKVPGTTGDK